MKRKLNTLFAFLMALALISCGGSDDDDNDDAPQREEETTGSSGTTGTTGTGGTTGSSTSCMSAGQRDNIRTFLNRASDLRAFNGSGTESTFEDDMRETRAISGSFDFVQSGENTWIINAAYCNAEDGANCQESQTVLAFRNGCLNVNGLKARIITASDSTLTYRILENGFVRERASLASGRLVIDQSVTRDGSQVYKLNFAEEAP